MSTTRREAVTIYCDPIGNSLPLWRADAERCLPTLDSLGAGCAPHRLYPFVGEIDETAITRRGEKYLALWAAIRDL